MKHKKITYSISFIVSILIISLFVWTAVAAGNTQDKIKNTHTAIANKDNLIKNAGSTTKYTTGSSVDYSDIPIEEDTVLPVEEEDVAVQTDDTPVDDSGLVEDTDNAGYSFDNLSAETNNTTDSYDSPVEDSNYLMPDDDSILSGSENNSLENISEIVNSTDEVDETNEGKEIDNLSDGDNFSIDNINTPVDGDNISTDDNNTPVDGDNNQDDNKPILIETNEPSESVCTNNVLFNFSVTDELDDNLTYTLYINGIEKSSDSIAEGECKEIEVNLEEGHYTWKIMVKDGLGNTETYGPVDLYVATKLPVLTLISPEDGFINTGGPLNFSFAADLASDAQNKEQTLNYKIDIDGNDIEGLGSGTMRPKDCIQTQNITNLSDGSHEWTVSVDDDAGNNANETRTFYIYRKGLGVSLISPNNENISTNPANFKFRVSGGSGLYFNYKLLVDGEEVKRTTCDGSSNKTLQIGDDFYTDYSIKASVPDGVDKMWTVNITDCTGNCYEPAQYHFSLDSTDPGRVTNLSARDAPGETSWDYISDSPALHVSWDTKSGGDLASTPYDVFISDSEPLSIEDMEKVKSTSETECLIEKYDEEPLDYGKDYWVAVIARDKSGNYNKCFIAVCGPVQTYEDMDIKLDAGWNMKSVPKKLLESNLSPKAVFGKNSTVLYWTGTAWEVPDSIEPCKGYWVYSPESFVNNVKFKPETSDNESDGLDESLNLSTGWHMIGPTSMQPEEWSTVLASLENSDNDYKFSNLITYSFKESWNGLNPVLGITFPANEDEPLPSSRALTNESEPSPVGMLQTEGIMVPGQGYWIYVDEEGIYTPSESGVAFEEVPVDDSMADNETVGEENTGNATTEIVDGNGSEEVTVVDDTNTDEEVTDVNTDEDLSADAENPENTTSNEEMTVSD